MPVLCEDPALVAFGVHCHVLEGHLRIAQGFNLGFDALGNTSPEGTNEGRSRSSAVPSGLIVSISPHPRLKPWAILKCPSGTCPCRSKLSSDEASNPSDQENGGVRGRDVPAPLPEIRRS